MGKHTVQDARWAVKKRIVFIDDEPRVLHALKRMLKGQQDAWEVVFFDRPEEAWDRITVENPDVVVSDVRMPGISGLDLLLLMQNHAEAQHIPVIMVTGVNDRRLKREALECGANDLLTKPFVPEELIARIGNALRLKETQDELRRQNEMLRQKVHERTMEMLSSRINVIWQIGMRVGYHGETSGNCVICIACHCRSIALRMGLEERFAETLFLAAPFFDIGGIGVPRAVLAKKETLTDYERLLLEQHCLIGARMLKTNEHLRQLLSQCGQWKSDPEQQEELLEMAISLSLTHHEHWDGSGYPQGLSGEKIPIGARILAVAHAYEGGLAGGQGKAPLSEEEVLDFIRNGAGATFDPQVVEVFLGMLDEIRSVHKQLELNGADFH